MTDIMMPVIMTMMKCIIRNNEVFYKNAGVRHF